MTDDALDSILAETIDGLPSYLYYESSELAASPAAVAINARPDAERVQFAIRLAETSSRWPRRQPTVGWLIERLLHRNAAASAPIFVRLLEMNPPAADDPYAWTSHQQYLLERFTKLARTEGVGERGVAFAERWLAVRGNEQWSARPSPMVAAMKEIVDNGPGAPPSSVPRPLDEALEPLLAHPDGAALVALAADVGTRSKPTKTWEKAARALLADEGLAELVADGVPAALEATKIQPDLAPFLVEHLKGLLWTGALLGDDRVLDAITDHVARCFVKVPGVGPRHPVLGTAGAKALALAPDGRGADGLFRLERTLRYASGRSSVRTALKEAYTRSGLDRRGLALRSTTGHPVEAEYAETWTHSLAEWRTWFAEHPDREDDAAEVLWWVTPPKGAPTLAWLDGTDLRALDGAALELADDSTVQLWHPAESDEGFVEEVAKEAPEQVQPQLQRPRHRPKGRGRGDRRLKGARVAAWPFEGAARDRGWTFSLSRMREGDDRAIRAFGPVAAELLLDLPDEDDNRSDAVFPPWRYMDVKELRFEGETLATVPARCFSEAMQAATELAEVAALRGE